MDTRWIPGLVFLGVVIIAVLAGAQPMFSGPGDCGASDYRDLPPCELTTHPPDVKVFNRGTETAYVTVTITDQGASETLVSGRVKDVHTFEDVVTTPGTYLVRGETDLGASDSYLWSVGEHVPTGGEVITVSVDENGSVSVGRASYP